MAVFETEDEIAYAESTGAYIVAIGPVDPELWDGYPFQEYPPYKPNGDKWKCCARRHGFTLSYIHEILYVPVVFLD